MKRVFYGTSSSTHPLDNFHQDMQHDDKCSALLEIKLAIFIKVSRMRDELASYSEFKLLAPVTMLPKRSSNVNTAL